MEKQNISEFVQFWTNVISDPIYRPSGTNLINFWHILNSKLFLHLYILQHYYIVKMRTSYFGCCQYELVKES